MTASRVVSLPAETTLRSEAHSPTTCEITLRVNHPEGYTYGIAATDYRGFANLEAGSRGTAKGHYFFPGMPTRHSSHTYSGPLSDNWQATDTLGPGSVLHGPCKQKKPLTVNVELKVVGKSPASFINGGLFQRGINPVTSPVLVVDVPDVEEALAKIEKLGGETVTPKTPVGDSGFSAYFKDPEGNLLGLWESVGR